MPPGTAIATFSSPTRFFSSHWLRHAIRAPHLHPRRHPRISSSTRISLCSPITHSSPLSTMAQPTERASPADILTRLPASFAAAKESGDLYFFPSTSRNVAGQFPVSVAFPPPRFCLLLAARSLTPTSSHSSTSPSAPPSVPRRPPRPPRSRPTSPSASARPRPAPTGRAPSARRTCRACMSAPSPASTARRRPQCW